MAAARVRLGAERRPRPAFVRVNRPMKEEACNRSASPPTTSSWSASPTTTGPTRPLTSLKQLDTQGQMGLREAAVVVRDEDGHLDVKDQVADEGFIGTASG